MVSKHVKFDFKSIFEDLVGLRGLWGLQFTNFELRCYRGRVGRLSDDPLLDSPLHGLWCGVTSNRASK